MKQEPEPQRLTPSRLEVLEAYVRWVADYVQRVEHPYCYPDTDSHLHEIVREAALLLRPLELGAEPYWMQDVRCAQRAINDERARLRAARESSRSEPE